MSEAISKDLITTEYLAQLQELHRHDENWGTTGQAWTRWIAAFAQRVGAESIVDYGCGKGLLVSALRRTLPFYDRIEGYDPAIEESAAMPKPADIVSCTDVLEHIEPELIDNVLAHIASLTNKAAFLVISMRRAKAILPDGRNAHLIIEGEDYWMEKVKKAFPYTMTGASGNPTELVILAAKTDAGLLSLTAGALKTEGEDLPPSTEQARIGQFETTTK